MQNWNLNPVTKDYVVTNGKPEETDTILIPAYIRLKVQRKKWLYAPDDDYGSDFYELKNKQSNRMPSMVENVAARALQPLIDDNRARSITVDFAQSSRHSIGLETKIINASGKVEQLSFPALEV